MSNKSTISQQIEDIHQQVREFVEKQYPEYQVTNVSNASETLYARSVNEEAKSISRDQEAKYLLRRIEVEFRVCGTNAERTKEMYCEVLVDYEGQMHIFSITQSGKRGFL